MPNCLYKNIPSTAKSKQKQNLIELAWYYHMHSLRNLILFDLYNCFLYIWGVFFNFFKLLADYLSQEKSQNNIFYENCASYDEIYKNVWNYS